MALNTNVGVNFWILARVNYNFFLSSQNDQSSRGNGVPNKEVERKNSFSLEKEEEEEEEVLISIYRTVLLI